MKTGSLVTAFFALVIYAFYLGFTQDSAHPVAAAIAAVHQNLTSTFIVFVATLTGVQLLLAFVRKSRWYYLLAPKKIVHRGVTYRTLEALKPGRPYKRVSGEDRSTVQGRLVVVFRTPQGCEPFLIADETRVHGMEMGIVYKERDTAATQGVAEVDTFFSTYSKDKGKMVLLPVNAQVVRRKHIKLETIDEYRSRQVPQAS